MSALENADAGMTSSDDRSPAAGPATTLAGVCDLLDATVLFCPDPGVRIEGIVAADLMSDVLVDSRPGVLLLTGLVNVQAIRTAAIADLAGVVFVRGKQPAAEVVELARDKHIPVFVTGRSLFDAAGALFAAGAVRPGERVTGHG